MSVVRFDPFRLGFDIDRVFQEMAAGTPEFWTPRLDVYEREGNLVIRTELPGVNPDDIDITVEENALVIRGVRRFEEDEKAEGFLRREIVQGEFRRIVYLSDELDTENIQANYENGILTVVVPKKPEVMPKKVQVKVQG